MQIVYFIGSGRKSENIYIYIIYIYTCPNFQSSSVHGVISGFMSLVEVLNTPCQSCIVTKAIFSGRTQTINIFQSRTWFFH